MIVQRCRKSHRTRTAQNFLKIELRNNAELRGGRALRPSEDEQIPELGTAICGVSLTVRINIKASAANAHQSNHESEHQGPRSRTLSGSLPGFPEEILR